MGRVSNRKRALALFAATGSIMAVAAPSAKATTTWIGTTVTPGSWSNSAYWNNGVPSSANAAILPTPGGGLVNPDINAAGASVSVLTMNGPGWEITNTTAAAYGLTFTGQNLSRTIM